VEQQLPRQQHQRLLLRHLNLKPQLQHLPQYPQLRRRQQLAKNAQQTHSEIRARMARMSVASDGSGSALVEANDGYAASAPVAPRNRRASCPEPSMPQMGHAGQAAYGQGGQQSPSLFLALGQHPEICQLSGYVAASAQGIAYDMATAGVTSNFHFEQFMTQYAKIGQAVQAITQRSPELASTDQNASIALMLLMIQAMQTPKQPQMV